MSISAGYFYIDFYEKGVVAKPFMVQKVMGLSIIIGPGAVQAARGQYLTQTDQIMPHLLCFAHAQLHSWPHHNVCASPALVL